jgi:hypothetical protein
MKKEKRGMIHTVEMMIPECANEQYLKKLENNNVAKLEWESAIGWKRRWRIDTGKLAFRLFQGSGRYCTKIKFNADSTNLRDFIGVLLLLFGLHRASLLKSFDLKRVDCYVDLALPTTSVANSVSYYRKIKTITYEKDGIESKYIGSTKSPFRVRVYDKKKQLRKRSISIDDNHLTRVEVQTRFPAKHLGPTNFYELIYSDEILNPFRYLRFEGQLDLDISVDVLAAFQLRCEKYGRIQAEQLMTSYYKRKYHDILFNPTTEIEPFEIFSATLNDWRTEYTRRHPRRVKVLAG